LFWGGTLLARVLRTGTCLLLLIIALRGAYEVAAGTANEPGSVSAWPMFRGNLKHTGRSAVDGPPAPAIRWIYTATNFISSSPALGSDGAIYFREWDNNLYALNPTGTPRWTFPTGSYIS